MMIRIPSTWWWRSFFLTLFFLLFTLFISYCIRDMTLKDDSPKKIITFSYSTGGFGGTQTHIRLDLERQVLELKESKQIEAGGDYKIVSNSVPLNDEIYMTIRTGLDESNFWNWKKDYGPKNILDGTYWSVRGQEAGGNLVESKGKMRHPEEWDVFSLMLSWLYKYIRDNQSS